MKRFTEKCSLKSALFFCILMLLGFTSFSQNTGSDTVRINGSIAATGIVQTGDENRTVFSLLSILKIGTNKYQFEPLTSLAYSTKPGKQVEGEYLENIIFRYHQTKTFYPAVGAALEQSFLRKINFRYTLSGVLVYNVLKKENQILKLAVGYSHEYTRYDYGAFAPPLDGKDAFTKSNEQFYTRIKGDHTIKKIKLSYDLFFQAQFENFSDNRWVIIGNADYFITKRVSIRASAINSNENFVATNVSNNNFRLTYGINIQL